MEKYRRNLKVRNFYISYKCLWSFNVAVAKSTNYNSSIHYGKCNFSMTGRLKTYLKNTIAESPGLWDLQLILLSIHRHIDVHDKIVLDNLTIERVKREIVYKFIYNSYNYCF